MSFIVLSFIVLCFVIAGLLPPLKQMMFYGMLQCVMLNCVVISYNSMCKPNLS